MQSDGRVIRGVNVEFMWGMLASVLCEMKVGMWGYFCERLAAWRASDHSEAIRGDMILGFSEGVGVNSMPSQTTTGTLMEMSASCVSAPVWTLPVCTDESSLLIEDPASVGSGTDSVLSTPHLGRSA